MAAADVALRIVLQASDQTKAGLESATTNITKLEKTTSIARVAMGALAGVASSGLVGALSGVANAAAQDAANVEKLRIAVENSGVAWEDNIRQIDERIKKGQGLAFTDTQVRDSLAALTQTTGDLNQAMNLQQLAFDLSRAKGMDLTTASELIGKVAEGNTGILKRYGVVLDSNATATEALAALQQKFGGQAEAYGNTTSAAIFKVHDSIDEWRESIGASLGPAQGLIALLPGLSDGMIVVSTSVGAVTPLIRDHISSLKSLGGTLAKGGIVLGALALAVDAIMEVGKTVDFVRENWEKFTYALTSGRLDDIPVFGFFFNYVRRALALVDALRSAWNTVTNIFSGAANRGNAPVTNDFDFGTYAEGTTRVPRTGLALLHKNEAVIPAAMNPWAGGNWGGPTLVQTVIQIDGREVARAISPAQAMDYRLAGGARGPF